MPRKPISSNTLFYGDNLDILREYITDESVDLIYLDPPFNSNRSYNVLFKDERGHEAESQITAFDDAWHWNAAAEQTFHALVTQGEARVAAMIGSLREFIGSNQMMAYLVMMAARLIELQRVLKPTGSLYLHCDPTASHYLKVVLDSIFGPENFRNEIVWQRTNAHNDRKLTRYGAVHDVLLYYTRSSVRTFIQSYAIRNEGMKKTHDLYRHTDGKLYRKGDCTAPGGRGPRYEWHEHIRNWRFTQEQARRLEQEGLIVYSATGMPRVLRPVEPEQGSPLQDVWTDIDPPNSGSAEQLGYPTQKPIALLERIILASSNPGDVVLDPFCGCGTTVAAAQKLARTWIGIDITHLSITLQKFRLSKMFPEGVSYQVIGEPTDISGARQLAEDSRYQFQWWALSLVPHARPLGGQSGDKSGKKGSDKGIDGVVTFIDDPRQKPKRILIQVKSGHVRSGDIRDLRGTVEREGAAIGVFITLEQPSSDMQTEAVTAGYYHSPVSEADYPKMQVLAIADLLHGAAVNMPSSAVTFRQAGVAEPAQLPIDYTSG